MQLLDLLQRERGVVSGNLSRHGSVHGFVIRGGSFQLRRRGSSRLLELRVDESHRQRAGSVFRVE